MHFDPGTCTDNAGVGIFYQRETKAYSETDMLFLLESTWWSIHLKKHKGVFEIEKNNKGNYGNCGLHCACPNMQLCQGVSDASGRLGGADDASAADFGIQARRTLGNARRRALRLGFAGI